MISPPQRGSRFGSEGVGQRIRHSTITSALFCHSWAGGNKLHLWINNTFPAALE